MIRQELCPNCGEIAKVDADGLHCRCGNFIPLQYIKEYEGIIYEQK
jgi:hypothetical protein